MRSLGIGVMVVGLAMGAVGCTESYKSEHVLPMSRSVVTASQADWLGVYEDVGYCTNGTYEVRLVESDGIYGVKIPREEPDLGFAVGYKSTPVGLEVTVYQGRPVGAIAITRRDGEEARMVPYSLDMVGSQVFVLLYDTSDGPITPPPTTEQLILCYQ